MRGKLHLNYKLFCFQSFLDVLINRILMKFSVTFLSQKDHYIIWHLQLFSTVQCLHYCSTAWVNTEQAGCWTHRVHIFTRDETGLVCLPTQLDNYTGDGKCNERGWATGVHPPPLPAWANFTLMMECTPESSRCYSVYSMVFTIC